MSRPIDADKLKKDVLDLPDCYNGLSDTYDKACIIGVIDEQPTIEEHKKGKWINEGIYGEGHSERAIRCSNCDWHYIGYLDDYKFCPNCGADMRGEGHEND